MFVHVYMVGPHSVVFLSLDLVIYILKSLTQGSRS